MSDPTQRPYTNGLTFSALTRLLSWLLLAVPLAVVAMGVAPADDDSATGQAEVDQPFTWDAPPVESGPPWPLATFLGDETVSFKGSASDLFTAGKMVTIGGDITGNAFVAGQMVHLENGRIDGDLFAAGESVTVDQALGQDLYLAGANCHLGADSSVRGNVYAGCGSLVIEGSIGGSLVGGAGDVTLDGPVAGDVDIEVGSLKLGPEADIAGDLHYTSPDEASIDGDAAVGGTVDFTMAEQWDDDDHPRGAHPSHGPNPVGFMITHTWSFVSALLVGFVLLALVGDRFRRTITPLLDQPGKSLGIGFALLVCIPVAAVIAIALLITMPMGFMTIALYAVAVYLAALLPALALGRLILQRSFDQEDPSPYGSLAVGLLLLHMVMAIPIFGFLFHVAVVSAGLGAVYLASRDAGEAPAA